MDTFDIWQKSQLIYCESSIRGWFESPPVKGTLTVIWVARTSFTTSVTGSSTGESGSVIGLLGIGSITTGGVVTIPGVVSPIGVLEEDVTGAPGELFCVTPTVD
jgi:hypothetical protein